MISFCDYDVTFELDYAQIDSCLFTIFIRSSEFLIMLAQLLLSRATLDPVHEEWCSRIFGYIYMHDVKAYTENYKPFECDNLP